MKLRDHLPHEAAGGEYAKDAVSKLLDVEVTAAIDGTVRGQGWPGKHKNVLNWYKLANGKAVGWNENPAIGWSFPVITLVDKNARIQKAIDDFNAQGLTEDFYGQVSKVTARRPILATDCDYEIVRISGVQGMRV